VRRHESKDWNFCHEEGKNRTDDGEKKLFLVLNRAVGREDPLDVLERGAARSLLPRKSLEEKQ